MGIVKSHGGFIQVESALGEGSTFEIWLPAQTSAAPPAPPAAEARMARGNGELILVVDDEALLRVMTRQTLEATGYVVFTAASGADAMIIYNRHKDAIEIVLTDMMLPALDGSGLIAALKKVNPAVRIIAASGLGSAEQSAKGPGRRRLALPRQALRRRGAAGRADGTAAGAPGTAAA